MNMRRHDEWAEAKRRCRLSDEALQMAKELDMGPRTLLKNIPARSEPWKLPVEGWIRELHQKRFGGRPRELSAQRLEGRAATSHSAVAGTGAKGDVPRRNLLHEAEQALSNRMENEPLEPDALAFEWDAIERDTRMSGGEIDEANEAALRRWRSLRDASRAITAALARIPAVHKVMLFGSVAAPLRKEVPRHRRLRRAGIEVWHECKDVDLAVWVDDLTALQQMKRAIVRALNDWQRTHQDWPGVAHHMVDVFLIEPRTNRFCGNLCHYGQCPKGKPECAVPGCGAQPFLKLYEGFRLHRGVFDGEHNVVLFDRAATSSPSTSPEDDIPF
jgi:hypothetical protein